MQQPSPPTPPVGEAPLYAGIVGRLIETFAPYTEASELAVASQFIVAFGNAVGRGPHFHVGETRHHANEFLIVCGPTSIGRKGDAEKVALSPFRIADRRWFDTAGPGLSSGEGLLWCVRDPVVKEKTEGKDAGQEIVVDEGVDDKRFLAIESEFSAPLKMFTREGNTLSNVLREGWDGRDVLRTRTKNSPTTATGAHVSVIGHSTPDDLRRYLADVEIANGTANRFIFVYVERSKLLPNPGRAPAAAREALAADLRSLLDRARRIGAVRFDEESEAKFEATYPGLTRHRPGLLGALLGRAPAHVRRLALIYALLDNASSVVRASHLESALALWDVAEASVERIFACRTGNDALDRILLELPPNREMTFEEIRREIFAGHIGGGKLRDALTLGVELGELRLGQRATRGRPAAVVSRRCESGPALRVVGGRS